MTTKQLLIPIAFIVVAILGQRNVHAEAWTDLSGTRTIEAKMIGVWADSIILLLDDGRRITVKLSSLQASSRIQARALATKMKTARQSVVDELQGQAKEAAAPAPNPIPKPNSAPAYVPLAPNANAAAQMQWFAEQWNNGHPTIALLDVLPKSYQDDVSSIIQSATKKASVDDWQEIVGSLHKIGDLVVTRQRWFFEHPRFQVMSFDSREQVKEITLLICGLLRDGLQPEAVDLQTIESTPLREWLLARDQAISPYLYELSQRSMSLSSPIFELVEEKEGTAIVKVTAGGKPMEQHFVKVDDRWVEEELSKKWVEEITAIKQGIADAPEGMQMSDIMPGKLPLVLESMISPAIASLLQPIITPLESAQDEREFQAQMESLFMQVQPMVSALASLSGKKRGGGSSDEYGDTDDYEMEMERQQMEEAARASQ